jgi:hypothetical protein
MSTRGSFLTAFGAFLLGAFAIGGDVEHLPRPATRIELAEAGHEKLIYKAALEVRLDRKKLVSRGIQWGAATKVVKAFLDEKSKFNMDQLLELKLVGEGSGGKTREYLLKDVAALDVEFSK